MNNKREHTGRWKKGQSGNPGGRPSAHKELSLLIQKTLALPDGTNLAVNKLIEVMEHGEHRDAVAAVKLLKGYGYGSPKQHVEMTGEDGGPLEVKTSGGRHALTRRSDTCSIGGRSGRGPSSARQKATG
jgi:hypothetical protein